jgi:tetratricopeptide (TPR) repeat protein
MRRSITVFECWTHRTLRVSATVALALICVASASAQIPDQFTNLQVFPKEISKGDLVRTMKSFTRALGVRCEHCHATRPGADPASGELSDLDFASDAREAKLKAREMLKMVRAINTDYLAKLPGGASHEVRCITCHHGLAEPETIDERVERLVTVEGIESAIADYRVLRAEYLTSGSYDFDEGPLNSLGEKLLRGGNPEAAQALLALNAEFHAESAWTQLLLGEALLAGGEREAAKAAFEKSLALEPDNPPAKKRLSELAAPAPAGPQPENPKP